MDRALAPQRAAPQRDRRRRIIAGDQMLLLESTSRMPFAVAALCAVLGVAILALASAYAREETFKLQTKPFVLSGFNTLLPKLDVPTPRRSGYITAMDAYLVDARGRRMPIRDVMLHDTYKLFRLHPVTMTQVIDVRP